jgi:hypothetical protein
MLKIKVGLDEKRLYRICKELEKKGESIVETNGKKEWNGTFRKWGIRAKPLLEKDLVYPVWITYNRKHLEDRMIKLKNNVIVEEKPGNNCSFFIFKEQKNGLTEVINKS